MNFHNGSITQNQEVTITSSGGFITKGLAKGLRGLWVDYEKAVYFPTFQIVLGGPIDLYLYPVNSSAFRNLDSLVQQQPPSSVQWQMAGTDYPTVTLWYGNGTQIVHSYPDQTLTVQPESVTNDAITSEIQYQRGFGIAVVGAVIGPLDAIFEATYRHFNSKETKHQ
ncbi:MAG TPA: hypothetical protein VJZ32_03130 [Candidatus Bathyarchaeia archaeon]|nr:hypothetical protein [Candidatus Bathyarchaeia archaeon]